ncbi:RNA-binding domain-containing protein [Psychrobacter sp. I-STPA6b]|uniref:RNA-binding domain-containing protein n=1 Tax=Psychrobacter sp. I-STPA6b TaxID=2585718 RepID=UPI001D0CCCA1|nr:RNA-binding domain-containing protein [Psychrobacter sp. I-STPA6b]
MDWLALISTGESKTLEFKRELPRYDQIAKTIVAFANTSGGRLLIGVDDDGSLLGIDESSILDLEERIYASLFERISPTINPDIYALNLEGKILLVIEVRRGASIPYYLKFLGKSDGVFIRIGSSNRLADAYYVAELERQRQHLSFDEQPYFDVDFKSLDITGLKQRFESAGLLLDKAKLLNLKLLTIVDDKEYPTFGLLILLGYFEHVSTQCARFKGSTMQVFLDRKEYTDDLFTQLEQAQIFVQNHLNLNGEINGLQRQDTLEIPLPAIREALVNAYVHRDYSNFGRNIKVAVYDDMVNIVSAGGLMPNLTVSDLYAGRSEIRNRAIARVFKLLGYIEQWGSGINRIHDTCVQAGLPTPIIEEKNDFINVELMRVTHVQDYAQSLTQKSSADVKNEPSDDALRTITDDYGRLRTITDDYQHLELDQQKVLLQLLEVESISRQDVMVLLSVEKTRAYNVLNSLVTLQLIKRHGKGRATVYMLT